METRTITKQQLEDLYRNRSNKSAAEELGISVPTLLKLIDENGIERKGSPEVKVKVV